MVVIAIVGLVAGVVVASFSGGISVWESASILTQVEREAYFSAENIRRDISGTFAFHDLGFRGTPQNIAFPGLVPVVDGDGNPRFRIGTVKYVYNSQGRSLARLTWAYPYPEDSADAEEVAEGVDAVQFSYLAPGADSEDGWTPEWEAATNFPAAVRMDIRISHKGRELAVRRDVPLMEGLWRKQ
jgi:type II secretory pathway pseudopilin PulG